MRLLVLAALLAGCGVEEAGLEPVELLPVRDAVWAFYGRQDAPPRLELRADAGCDGWGFRAGGECVCGAYYPSDDLVVLAIGTAGEPWFLAHELLHAVRWREGRPDHDHRGPGWGPGELVEQARAVVVEGRP